MHGIGDPRHGQQVGGGPHVARLALGDGQGLVEGLDHDDPQLVVDHRLGPVVAVEVLDPFEVADRHAAGVAQDVGDHEDAVAGQDLVGLRGGRAVGRLGNEPGLDPAGVPLGDLVLEGGRDQDVAVDLQDLGVGDVRGAREPLDRPVLLLPAHDPGDVEALGIVDPAGRVGDRDDGRPFLADEPRRDRARVAEPLDGHAGRLEVHADMGGGLDDRVDAAARRRLGCGPRSRPG